MARTEKKHVFLPFLKPYVPFLILSPLLMMAEVVADLCLPTMMSNIVDYGINGTPFTGGASLGDALHGGMLALLGAMFPTVTGMHVIVSYGILMLLTVLLGGFFGTMCAYTAARAAQGFGNDLRCHAFRKVMSLSIEQTDRFTTGSLVTRMTSDITMLMDFVEALIRMFVRPPVFFIGGTVALLALDVSFGAILLISLPIMAVAMTLVLRKAIPLYTEVQNRLDRVNSVVQENVSGARVIKAYVREDYECRRFDGANGALRDVNYRVLKLMCIIHPLLNVVMNASIIAIVAIGGIRVTAGDGVTTGNIMAAITYVTQVLMSIMMMSMIFQSASRAMASSRRLGEVLETDAVILGEERGEENTEAPAIRFTDVTFHYPGTTGRPVLKNVSFEVKRGEFFAIIGATGVGKTTLLHLPVRFYDATEGTVEVFGRNVKDRDPSLLRKEVGYVMQKSELFSDTVENNIRWGRDGATEEEVHAAAKIAQADGFITSFQDGYQTFVAEKGASLSGGQKQRLSIARALLRKPKLLLFDDATSALDLVTEGRLQRSVRETLEGTTFVMVAQRIASVKGADRIAVLEEDGTVRHVGTHEELLRESETYRSIVASQNRKEVDSLGE